MGKAEQNTVILSQLFLLALIINKNEIEKVLIKNNRYSCFKFHYYKINSKSKYLLFKETQISYISDDVNCDTLGTLLDLSDTQVIDDEELIGLELIIVY